MGSRSALKAGVRLFSPTENFDKGMHYVKVSTPFEDSDLVKETLEEVQFNKIKTESQLLIRRQPTDSLEPIENMNPLQKSNS